MNLSRRNVLAGTAGAVIAMATNRSHADEPADGLIIDTHQHLWDLSKFQLPWLADAPDVYRHDYRPQEYAEATRGANIRAVYMEVDVAPAQRPAEAEYVIELCRTKSGATRAAVIGGLPGSPGFADYIHKFAKSGFVRGVRQVLHSPSFPAGACLKEEFVRDIHLLGKLNLCYDLCMRPTELRDGLKLTELAPETRFVIDHCGNADVGAFFPKLAGTTPSHQADSWKRDMEVLAKRPNTICKISGIVARAPENWKPEHLAPIVNHCLDVFGPDRVVFGGDWPVCLVRSPLMGWINALREIIKSRPVGQQRRLWSENAKKFYALAL